MTNTMENDTNQPGELEDLAGATPPTPPAKVTHLNARRPKTPKLLGIAAGIAALAAVGGGFLATQGGASTASAAANGGSIASIVQTAASTTSAGPNATTEDFIAKLAARLGIDETTLKADLTQTSLDELSAQVAAGNITQAKADKITTSINNGDNYFFGAGGGPGGPGGMHPGPGGPEGGFIGRDSAALATFLGIDQATLRTDLQGGQSLATIATAQGKTRDQLKTFLTNEVTTQLGAQVTAGKLTQAQSDDMLSHFAANLDAQIDGTMPQRGTGGPGRGPAGSNAPST
ncbi:MAG TPA: hypothetical protein VFY10_09915, partial [Dehalococcoidia bacterium]|nr:hypothetical protein [Dehalococcoidia bacterium]